MGDSGSLDPGKSTGRLKSDVRCPESEVLTGFPGCCMRMISDVDRRVGGSGIVGDHNVALMLF